MRSSLLTAIVVILLATTVAWATNVTFQVNMGFQRTLGNFDPTTNSVVVRGGFNNWSGNGNMLTDPDGDSIYVGTWDVPTAVPDTTYQYKFLIVGGASDVWEADPNREFTVGADTLTLPVVWFNRQEPVVTANVEVSFSVDMNIQILVGSFNPEVDWVIIRGNHTNLGNWGGEIRLDEVTGSPGIYSILIQFDDMPVGTGVGHKFLILEGGVGGTAHWESGSDRLFTPTGNEPDNLPPPSGNGYGEILLPVVYYSNTGPDDIITNPVNAVFQVDIRPLYGRIRDEGYVQDVQGGDTIFFVESIQIAGDNICGWPWGSFPLEYFLNDNGQDGDVAAGDSVWSLTVLFPAASARSQIYKYGANQLDAEAGFAMNHIVNLDDSQPTFMVPSDCWGSPDTLYDDWPCLLAGSDGAAELHPLEYQLSQNYPNPFNPSTMISFVLPRAELAKLAVFDVLGRQVATIVDGRLEAGKHIVSFDGSWLSSGVYFYRLEAGSFRATHKMLLLK
ncbi:T9SS type A sorting domain-containing protein [bacterium]|nr:T9SS type A sorting domain-containing protein [bacterium]MBU1984413.1 T9SS type A sorting domain-containing protein [bacterium]